MDIQRELSAAILVGRSTRMGRDKALLELNQQTFIGHLAHELSGCREVFAVACVKRDYSDAGLEVLVDERQNVGPMEGIRQALRHAATDLVFICAVDMPFFHREMAEYLAERIAPGDDACVFRDGARVHPLCGIYRRTALPVIEQMLDADRRRMMELLSRLRTQYVDITSGGFAGESLSNINTWEEYVKITRDIRQEQAKQHN